MHKYPDMMRFSGKNSRPSGKFLPDSLIDRHLNMIVLAPKGAERSLKRKGEKAKTEIQIYYLFLGRCDFDISHAINFINILIYCRK